MKTINLNQKTFNVNPTNEYFSSFWDEVAANTWEPYSFSILDQYLDKNHSFIDIGAWIGPLSIYASFLSKHVYAIEPDEIAFNDISSNLQSNNFDNVSLFKKCISDVNGTVSFGNSKQWGNSGSSLLQGRGFFIDGDCDPQGNWKVKTEVESVTLHKFFEENKIEDCNFIKIDIEGAETIVIPHIKNLLQENGINLYLSMHPKFFNNYNDSFQEIINCLRMYPKVYDTNGSLISLESLRGRSDFYSIVCEF